MKPPQATADYIWSLYQKVFKGVKNPPRFSFLMRCVKLNGEDATVRALESLRETKTFHKISDFQKYISKIIKL